MGLSRDADEKVQGTLVIIGGAEDKDGDCLILRRFAKIAGGAEARIAVMTSATEEPETVGKQYKALFEELGAGVVEILHVNSRAEANEAEKTEIVHKATGIFFTGGDQLRITSTIGGTAIGTALQAAYRRGVVIAGTSAGASVMTDVMVVGGNNDDAPKKDTLSMAPGLALLKGVVVDQHFAQRGRIGRLLSAVAYNPYVLGVGIDEDTAVIVSPDATFEVIGSQTVTVVDGSHITVTNVSEQAPDEPLALSNVILHVLPQGHRFDLRLRHTIG
ncbi:MAG: cyanophycinase [Syntrophothermus sp.]